MSLGISNVSFCCRVPAKKGAAVVSKAGNAVAEALEPIKKQLEERLAKLNTSKAPHRPSLKKDNERFGQDGIKTILRYVKTKDDAAKINAMLDELEKGKSLWTSDICKAMDSSYGVNTGNKLIRPVSNTFKKSKV